MGLGKKRSPQKGQIRAGLCLIATALISLCAVIPAGCGNTGAARATVTVDGTSEAQGEISPYIYGGFIEFKDEVINGRTGIWAQELYNRGFDEPDANSDGYS